VQLHPPIVASDNCALTAVDGHHLGCENARHPEARPEAPADSLENASADRSLVRRIWPDRIENAQSGPVVVAQRARRGLAASLPRSADAPGAGAKGNIIALTPLNG